MKKLQNQGSTTNAMLRFKIVKVQHTICIHTQQFRHHSFSVMSFGKAARFSPTQCQGPGPAAYPTKTLVGSGPSYSFGARLTAPMPSQKIVRGVSQGLRKTQKLPCVQRRQLSFGDELGRGGMAIVSKVRCNGLFRAAKLWRPRRRQQLLPGQETKDRDALLAEAQKLHILQHPNIVKIFAVVQKGEVVDGMLLEVLGPTLNELGQVPKFSAHLKTALQDTCRALMHLHLHLMCHNDVKPQNVAVASKQIRVFKLIDMDASMTV